MALQVLPQLQHSYLIPTLQAWKARYNEKPKITFIVVQKRHHTRLFPNDRQWTDRSGNILPG